MANVDLDEVKKQWVGHVYETTTHRVRTEKMLQWALACGETESRFIDPTDADFQAHPAFTCQFANRFTLPKDFPSLGNGRGVDGGKTIELHTPIRAEDVLTGASQIADVYKKTGRSGSMIFIVHRVEFTNQDGAPVATVDTKQIRATDE